VRVVSLLPSATEILCAIGEVPVGVSHECDFPPAASDRPAVTISQVDTETGDCGAVDRTMQETVGDGDAPYAIDVERLDTLAPDLIVTQGLCDVCAVDRVLVRDAVGRIDADPEILTTDPHSLDDVLDDVRRIGAAVDRASAARSLVDDLQARIDRVERRARAAIDAGATRPSTVVLDWFDPVMVAGHWVPGMIETAGGTYPLADPGDHSTPREWTEVRECDPDVLIGAPCGFELERARDAATALAERPGWDDIRAVPDRVHCLDGSALANRPGPRLVDTLEAFAGLLHPQEFEVPVPVARPPAVAGAE
jgi:iron complex transport system substrate-binding protein